MDKKKKKRKRRWQKRRRMIIIRTIATPISIESRLWRHKEYVILLSQWWRFLLPVWLRRPQCWSPCHHGTAQTDGRIFPRQDEEIAPRSWKRRIIWWYCCLEPKVESIESQCLVACSLWIHAIFSNRRQWLGFLLNRGFLRKFTSWMGYWVGLPLGYWVQTGINIDILCWYFI